MSTSHIVYDYDTYGYTIEVLDDIGDTVYSYEAGNYRLESTTVVGTWHPFHVETKDLRVMAKQTAIETADEYGIEHKHIYLDRDLRDYQAIRKIMEG